MPQQKKRTASALSSEDMKDIALSLSVENGLMDSGGLLTLDDLEGDSKQAMVVEEELRQCRSCNTKKREADFIHPTKLTVGRTCASCIQKKSGAGRQIAVRDEVSTLLANHEVRLSQLEEAKHLFGRSTCADLAEWLPLRDPDEEVQSGDLVEMVHRKISRTITGHGVLFVVSSEPFFVGNVPDLGSKRVLQCHFNSSV